jgi:hypothetical protein
MSPRCVHTRGASRCRQRHDYAPCIGLPITHRMSTHTQGLTCGTPSTRARSTLAARIPRLATTRGFLPHRPAPRAASFIPIVSARPERHGTGASETFPTLRRTGTAETTLLKRGHAAHPRSKHAARQRHESHVGTPREDPFPIGQSRERLRSFQSFPPDPSGTAPARPRHPRRCAARARRKQSF